MVNVSSVLAVRTGKEISDAYAAGKACVILLTGRVTSTWGERTRVRAKGRLPRLDRHVDDQWLVQQEPAVEQFWWEHSAHYGRVGTADVASANRRRRGPSRGPEV